jgi:allantoin racemase
VLTLEREPDLTRRRLAEEAENALERDGAEVIVLGCGGLGGFDKVLQSRLNVPVIDGIVAAVKMAEACCDYGVQTSKKNAFAQPRPKPIEGWPSAAASANSQGPGRVG